MGGVARETPTKVCEWCSAQFTRGRVGKDNQLECYSNFMRRRFCSVSCSVSRQHATPAPSDQASRKRASKLKGCRCESCGRKEDLVMHHVNGKPRDNKPNNLQTLCNTCHSFWHALLRRIGKRPKVPMPRLIEWK